MRCTVYIYIYGIPKQSQDCVWRQLSHICLQLPQLQLSSCFEREVPRITSMESDNAAH